jgi:hypothetical protein
LAQVSVHSGLISNEVYNATLAASLITILVNASLFKLMRTAPASLPSEEEDVAPDRLGSADMRAVAHES